MMEDLYTVSQITEILAGLIEGDPYLTDVRVVGEVADVKSRRRHLYFNLVEEGYRLPCVFFGRGGIDLEEGEMVEVRGSVGVYRKGGYYSFRVQSLRRLGTLGLNAIRVRKAIERLILEGLLPKPRKELPIFPFRIGILTSKDSASYRDVLGVLRGEGIAFELYLLNSGVQGEEAKGEILKALERAKDLPLDSLIITRGGGSRDDLWIFNDEDIARRVIEMPFPVITGIGHSIDRVLLDLVADYVEITPTAAAQLIVKRQREYLESLRDLYVRLKHLAILRIHEKELGLSSLLPRLKSAMMKLVLEESESLERLRSRLEASSPSLVLERGFAVVLKDGRKVSSVQDVSAGDVLKIVLRDGRLKVRVHEVGGDNQETGRDS